MRLHSMFTAIVICIVAAAATTLDQNGSATGTLKVNGKTSAMKYAYAYSEPLDAKGQVDIVMIVSDQVLPKAVLKNVEQLHELSDKGKFEGVRIVIHDDQRVMSAAPFSKALTGYVSTALYAEFIPKVFTPNGIEAESGRRRRPSVGPEMELRRHAQVGEGGDRQIGARRLRACPIADYPGASPTVISRGVLQSPRFPESCRGEPGVFRSPAPVLIELLRSFRPRVGAIPKRRRATPRRRMSCQRNAGASPEIDR